MTRLVRVAATARRKKTMQCPALAPKSRSDTERSLQAAGPNVVLAARRAQTHLNDVVIPARCAAKTKNGPAWKPFLETV